MAMAIHMAPMDLTGQDIMRIDCRPLIVHDAVWCCMKASIVKVCLCENGFEDRFSILNIEN